MNSNILFLGGSSLLAYAWCNSLANTDNIFLGVHNRKPELSEIKTLKINFDLIDDFKQKLLKNNIRVIINCIGYTNVENCEINPEKANKINTELPSIISIGDIFEVTLFK